mgnify:CR=1 FL=1
MRSRYRISVTCHHHALFLFVTFIMLPNVEKEFCIRKKCTVSERKSEPSANSVAVPTAGHVPAVALAVARLVADGTV